MKKTYRKTKRVRKGKRSKTVRSKRRVGGVDSPGIAYENIYQEPKTNMIDDEFARKKYNKIFDNYRPGRGLVDISDIPSYDEAKDIPNYNYTKYIDKNQNVNKKTPFFKRLYNRTFRNHPKRISLGNSRVSQHPERDEWKSRNSETI